MPSSANSRRSRAARIRPPSSAWKIGSTSGCTLTLSDLDPSDAARVVAVIARVPGWEGRAHVVGALSGGMTNRNHVVTLDGQRFVVRVPGPDTQLLEIDRECERFAASSAAALGVAPPVLGIFEGCLVTQFVAGAEMTADDFEQPETLDDIASILRAFHTSPPLPHNFDAFAVPRLHRDAAASRGVPIPDSFVTVDRIVTEIETAFAVNSDPRCPCHNDLLRANFLRDDTQLWLLDWEYAGMNDPSFDLGNLAVNNGLSTAAEEHLVLSYFGRVTRRRLARVRLMKLVSDAREAMWGVVQQGISTIDFDYRSYADEHFDRLSAHAASPAYPTWLAAAAGPQGQEGNRERGVDSDEPGPRSPSGARPARPAGPRGDMT